MIARASKLGMVEGRFSKPLRGVGLLAMLDAGMDTMRHIESVCTVTTVAGVLRMLVHAVAV